MALLRKYRGISEQMKGATNSRSCEVTSGSFYPSAVCNERNFKPSCNLIFLNMIFNGLNISPGTYAREKKEREMFATSI